MNDLTRPRRRIAIARWIYLWLAFLGLIFPARRYLLWVAEHGFDPAPLIAELQHSALIAGISGTAMIVTTTAVIFICTECRARRDKTAMICIPLTLVLGVGFGLPLYLYMRQRARD